MKEIFLFIFTSYGISNIGIYGSLFDRFREYCKRISPNYLGKLLSCMICLPTNVGFILSIGAHITGLTQFSPFASAGLEIPIIAIFLDGCFASGTVWLIHTYQEYLERK